MKFVLFALLAVALYASANGNPVQEIEPRDLNDEVRKLIEQFRRAMPCGVPAWGIPVLAPIRADNVHIDINLVELTARATLRNLLVSNTNQFTVQSVDFSPIRLRLALKLHFPVLSIRTDFQNAVGRSFNCQVNGNGNADGDLYNLSADVEGQLVISIWGKLSVSRLTSSVSIGSARVNLNSFVSNNDACNAELSRTLPQTFRNNQPFINKMVSDIVLPLANGVLQNMSLSDLLDLINGNTPSPFPPC